MRKLKILIVEDNRTHYSVLVDVLGEDNYDFVWAITADEGWEMAHREKPDLIIGDVILQKDMEAGFDLCRRLKADAATKNIPVLIMTRRSLSADVAEGTGVGADGYVTKPYSPAVLRDTVRQLLSRLSKN